MLFDVDSNNLIDLMILVYGIFSSHLITHLYFFAQKRFKA